MNEIVIEILNERLKKSREISNKQQETTDLLLKKTEKRLKEVKK